MWVFAKARIRLRKEATVKDGAAVGNDGFRMEAGGAEAGGGGGKNIGEDEAVALDGCSGLNWNWLGEDWRGVNESVELTVFATGVGGKRAGISRKIDT